MKNRREPRGEQKKPWTQTRRAQRKKAWKYVQYVRLGGSMLVFSVLLLLVTSTEQVGQSFVRLY